MKNYAALMILSLSLALVFGGQATAQAPAGGPVDDELGIGEEIKKEEGKKEGEKVKQPKVVTKEDIPPINMVLVKGGCFDMGDFTGDGDEDELPAHEVCLDSFYIADTEVTQELFEIVMGGLPRPMAWDPKAPANYVSFTMAKNFIQKLNQITNGYYRLPTEAEWEYAARAGGKQTVWSGTDNEAELGDYTWFSDNSDKLKPVKSKKPNALGLYDMSGNATEWVEDFFDFEYYKDSPKTNPEGPNQSAFRVIRGGSFDDPPFRLRTTYRYGLEYNRMLLNVGFRLAE